MSLYVIITLTTSWQFQMGFTIPKRYSQRLTMYFSTPSSLWRHPEYPRWIINSSLPSLFYPDNFISMHDTAHLSHLRILTLLTTLYWMTHHSSRLLIPLKHFFNLLKVCLWPSVLFIFPQHFPLSFLELLIGKNSFLSYCSTS